MIDFGQIEHYDSTLPGRTFGIASLFETPLCPKAAERSAFGKQWVPAIQKAKRG
jgi:hypothetical protein